VSSSLIIVAFYFILKSLFYYCFYFFPRFKFIYIFKGPALAIAVAIAAQAASSEVIVSTDGESNMGVGMTTKSGGDVAHYRKVQRERRRDRERRECTY
jgi:hypothetical protein